MKRKDRVAIVTDASSGIGRGICLEFARQGLASLVADIQAGPKSGIHHKQDATQSMVEKIGGQARFVQTDVADETRVRKPCGPCRGRRKQHCWL